MIFPFLAVVTNFFAQSYLKFMFKFVMLTPKY